MRRLLAFVVILAGLYSGYWFLGSSQLETRAAAAVERLRARGWDISYSDLSTSGYPSRFDTTVTDLAVASPDGDFGWTAPFVQVFALSYRPNHVIAVWPPEQQVTVAGQTVQIASERQRASAAVGLSADLPLRDATVESGPLRLDGSGWTVSLDRLLAAVRAAGPAPAAYDLWFEGEGLASPAMPATLDLLRLDAELRLDAPLDRKLQNPPRFLGLSLREVRLTSGDLTLTASGDLAPDTQGYLSGTVTLAAENWQSLLDLLERAGLLVFDQRAFLERVLAELAGGGDRIEIPVRLQNGQIEALGVVLTQAPRVL